MTDDERLPDPLSAARMLPRGSLVILRSRDDARRAELARSLAVIARAKSLELLIAADPELAVRSGAHGVHFPEARIGDAATWRVRRPRWFITCAAHSLSACARAKAAGADAVLLAPVFGTASHPGQSPLGPLRAGAIARQAPLPVYALGGINSGRAPRLAGLAFAGLAAIEALSGFR